MNYDSLINLEALKSFIEVSFIQAYHSIIVSYVELTIVSYMILYMVLCTAEILEGWFDYSFEWYVNNYSFSCSFMPLMKLDVARCYPTMIENIRSQG